MIDSSKAKLKKRYDEQKKQALLIVGMMRLIDTTPVRGMMMRCGGN